MKKKLILFISLFLLSILIWVGISVLSPHNQDESFSFIVFGDSRNTVYLPYNSKQINKIEDIFDQMTMYAYGPDAAVEKEMSFDPETKKLDWYKYWPKGAPEEYELTILKNGWPHKIMKGPKADVILRAEGQKWVYNQVLLEMKNNTGPSRNPLFVLNTGDMVYWGYQGKTLKKSPYWRDFYERFVSKLAPGSPEGLPARFFPVPGNHETWFDEKLEGFHSTMPYLTQMGFSAGHRIYKFDYKGNRFIFLDSGGSDYRSGAFWNSKHPDFQKQMTILSTWLNEARSKGIRQVFITFHKPAFTLAGCGPLPQPQNPHKYIKPFASDLNITVFNGHVHTTEMYLIDGIRYLVLGGGGAEQTFHAKASSKDYPEELYWKGRQRVLDYNYVRVHVTGDGSQIYLKRFRPGTKDPIKEIELYKE